MGTTSPDGIGYPDSGYTGGVRLAIKDTADTTQTALAARAGRVFRPADAAARTALSSSYALRAGDLAFQVDTAITYRHNGTTWKEWESDWITWATAPTNLTVGSGGSASSLQRYKWITGRLYFDFKFVLGSSGASMGTSPTLNLPVTVTMNVTGSLLTGDGAVRDVSVPSTPAYTKASLGTTTTVTIVTYTGTTASITSTAPMTWAAGDILAGGFWAEPA